jgi:hypothetical protein
MDIREALTAEHSKLQTMAIVSYIDSDPARFRELMDIFLGDEYRLTQRAFGRSTGAPKTTPNW